MLPLPAHALSQPEVRREDALQLQFAADLARDVADDPAKVGPDCPCDLIVSNAL
jgi:hypothetical protein